MPSNKRIRFGIVFEGERPDNFEHALDLKSIECCQHEGKQYCMLTTNHGKRVDDVLQIVNGMGIQLLPFDDASGLVLTFEKGHAFQSHEFYKIIQNAKAANDTTYWFNGSVGRKRVISELQSDLVPESMITPTALKRVSGVTSNNEVIIWLKCGV